MDQKYLTVTCLSLKEIRRVFSKIKIDPAVSYNGFPCWIWTACIFNSGYSRIQWRHRESIAVHRILYAWLVHPLPRRVAGEKTPQLDHLCKNKLCCNPIHLELVSPKINILRGDGRAAQNANKSHCCRGHKFTTENTIWDTPNHRSCKKCRRAKAAKAQQAPDYHEKQREYARQYRQRHDRDALRKKWREYYHRNKHKYV